MVIRSNVFAVKGVPQIGVLFSVMNLPKVYWYNFRDTSKRGKKLLGAHQLNSTWVTQLDPCKKKKLYFFNKGKFKKPPSSLPVFLFFVKYQYKTKELFTNEQHKCRNQGSLRTRQFWTLSDVNIHQGYKIINTRFHVQVKLSGLQQYFATVI